MEANVLLILLAGLLFLLMAGGLLYALLGKKNENGAMLEEFSRTRREFGELGAGLRVDLQSGLKAQLEQQREETKILSESLTGLRLEVENRLKEIETKNELKLEQMRVTVDEKLQGTLEKR